MFKRLKLKELNKRIIVYILALCLIGVLVISSATDGASTKSHIFDVCVGLVIMIVASMFDYTYLLKFYRIFYLLAILLLAAVFTPLGVTYNGATRWIGTGSFSIQPSELAKLLLILFAAVFLAKYAEKINNWKTILFYIVLIGIPAFLIFREPNLSTTIIVLVIFITLLFVAGLSYKIVLTVLAIGIPSFITVMILIIRQIIPMRTYQYNRIMAWRYPMQYSDNAYQQQYSIRAIASGQLWGKGLFNDSITSVKNGNFISEPTTDFIFAIIGEEMGFVGCLLVVGLLVLIVFELLWMAQNALDLSGRLICTGVAMWIGFQAFVNICVTTGLMPNTGVTLPFVSHGLTSFVSLFAGVGIALNVSMQSKKYRTGDLQ